MARTMKTGLNATLDPTLRSSDALEFETSLRRRIVGQDPAVEKVAEIYQMFLAGLNPPGTPGGKSALPGAHRLRQDARGGSHGGVAVRRPSCLHQDRLRRVPALARDRQADRLAAGIPGPSRDPSPADAGSAQSVAHREAEALDPAVRRNREGLRRAVAVAAGHS